MGNRVVKPPEPPVTIAEEIIWGSVLLLVCGGVHVAAIVWAVGLLERLDLRFTLKRRRVRLAIMVSAAFVAMIVAQTIQVWIWALSFRLAGLFLGFEEALYFAMATYTTVGYGDVVLEPGFRVFASMAAVNGLLSFGLSTAFLVDGLSKLMVIGRR